MQLADVRTAAVSEWGNGRCPGARREELRVILFHQAATTHLQHSRIRIAGGEGKQGVGQIQAHRKADGTWCTLV